MKEILPRIYRRAGFWHLGTPVRYTGDYWRDYILPAQRFVMKLNSDIAVKRLNIEHLVDQLNSGSKP